MVWNLHPINYGQASGRNWYNPSYRRTGTYKGMGYMSWNARGMGQTLPPPEVQTPQDQAAAGTITDVTGTDIGASTAATLAAMSAAGTLANPGSATAINTSATQWLPIAIAAGGLLLLIGAMGRR